MGGMNRYTGANIEGWEHCKQSILDILTTPLGSRVLRRDYGSLVYQLMDRPQEPSMLGQFTIVVGQALARWEPRFLLERVVLNKTSSTGHVDIGIHGVYYPEGHLGLYTVSEQVSGEFFIDRLIK